MSGLVEGIRSIRRKLKNKEHDEIANLVRYVSFCLLLLATKNEIF